MDMERSRSVRQQLMDDLRTVYGGQRFLLAVDVVQGYRGMAAELADLGGEVAFVLAGRVGTGPLPEQPWHALGLPPGADIVDAIHTADRALAQVSDEVSAKVDAVDPDRELLTLAAFFSAGAPVAGRRVFGARPKPWRDLEDKTVIDALWDAAGMARARSEVVPCNLEALQAAAARLDEGQGTVWAGDAREGFHGGAVRTRWVRDEADALSARDALAPHCDMARVMPFLEGLPCSIHGVVLPDGVAVFRPAEMLVLRNADGFVYARAATLWDPPPALREQMREGARRVGQHLASAYGYRGAYTVDGVMTVDGFRPTELNPRVGAAMSMLSPGKVADPVLPFTLLHFALIEGFRPSVTAQELEAAVLAVADTHRIGSFGFSTPGNRTETETFGLRWTDGRWAPCDPEEGHLRVSAGPGPTGDFINARLSAEAPSAMGIGRSLAPAVAAFVAWADAELGTSLGPLTPAPDLHEGWETHDG